MLIACPSCQRQLNVPDNVVGKQVRCPAPDCGTVFFVPATAPTAAAPAAVPSAPVRPAKPAAAKPVAPRPAAPRPAAPRSAPKTQPEVSPFNFGGGGAVAGPEADFGFTDHHDGGLRGIGMRTRLGRAAGWLNMAAGSMVLFTLFVVGISIAMFVMYRSWPSLVVGGCAPFLALPIPILILVGARMLSRARRWGIALVATIASLIVGMITMILMVGFGAWGLALAFGISAVGPQGAGADVAKLLMISSCTTGVLSAIVAFFSIFGGFVAMRALFNAEIKKAFT
jgi:hypothetical protein